MKLISFLLQDASVHRTVKPHIFSVFGDIALAIGLNFKKYLDLVIGMLNQASQAQVDKVCLQEQNSGYLNGFFQSSLTV